MITARGSKEMRLQDDQETTTTGIATTMVCRRMCNYHHYNLDEEKRLTTTTGDRQAQGEGCHHDTTTRKTAMPWGRLDYICSSKTNKSVSVIFGKLI